MGKHSRAVNTFPPEGVMRKFVGFVPTEFLRKEPTSSAVLHNLRKSSGITEVVGKKRPVTTDPKPRFKRSLTVNHLAQQTLTSWQIEIGFNPHPAHWFPLP